MAEKNLVVSDLHDSFLLGCKVFILGQPRAKFLQHGLLIGQAFGVRIPLGLQKLERLDLRRASGLSETWNQRPTFSHMVSLANSGFEHIFCWVRSVYIMMNCSDK